MTQRRIPFHSIARLMADSSRRGHCFHHQALCTHRTRRPDTRSTALTGHNVSGDKAEWRVMPHFFYSVAASRSRLAEGGKQSEDQASSNQGGRGYRNNSTG